MTNIIATNKIMAATKIIVLSFYWCLVYDYLLRAWNIMGTGPLELRPGIEEVIGCAGGWYWLPTLFCQLVTQADVSRLPAGVIGTC